MDSTWFSSLEKIPYVFLGKYLEEYPETIFLRISAGTANRNLVGLPEDIFSEENPLEFPKELLLELLNQFQ